MGSATLAESAAGDATRHAQSANYYFSNEITDLMYRQCGLT